MLYPARVRHLILLLVVALLLASPAVAGKKEKAPTVFVPDLGDEPLPEGTEVDGTTWSWSRPEYRVSLRRIDDADRQKYIRNATGSPSDPFSRQPNQSKGFLTFLLLIENLDSEYLIYQPQNSWLTSKHRNIEYPIDEGTIRSIYTIMEQELSPAYEKAIGAILDGEKMVYRGEKVHGLLVYRLPNERMKEFVVDVRLALDDGGAQEFTASYRALKKGEQQP